MSGRRAPQTIDDWTVEFLWENFRDNYWPGEVDPEFLQKVRHVFIAGALGVTSLWYGLELRRDISEKERRAIAARLVSEGRKICTDMDLPEALRSGLQ